MTNNAENTKPLKLFVTLPVKASQIDRYLSLTFAEIAGARSEEGNSAFFAYRDAVNINTMYLFEHWNSEEWLRDVHGEKGYYKDMRSVESEVLEGTVGERFLTEIEPFMPTPAPAGPVGHARVTIVRDAHALEKRFAAEAPDLRSAVGNLGLWLLSDKNAEGEYLLLEHWDSEASRHQVENGVLSDISGTVLLLDEVQPSKRDFGFNSDGGSGK